MFVTDDKAKTYLNKRADVESVSKLGMIFIAEYLGLARLSSDQITSLYKAVWPMMIIDKRHVFSNVGQSNCATFTETTYDVNLYRFPGAKSHLVVKNNKYTKINVRQFWEVVLAKLGGQASDKQDLINLSGFIMINCMRLIKKESTCLDTHMIESGTQSFQSLYGGWLKVAIPPPGGDFTLRFQTSFPGNSLDSKMLFACLVTEYSSNPADQNLLGLLKAGGMLALSDNGLGLISWSVKAADKMGVAIGVYIQSLLINQPLMSSMDRLIEFTALGNERGVTWNWCRLFNETALFDYSTRKNKDAAVLSALVVLGDPNKLIGMSQFRDLELYIRKYEPIATAVINYYSTTTGGTVGSVAAQAIMANSLSHINPTQGRLVNRPTDCAMS